MLFLYLLVLLLSNTSALDFAKEYAVVKPKIHHEAQTGTLTRKLVQTRSHLGFVDHVKNAEISFQAYGFLFHLHLTRNDNVVDENMIVRVGKDGNETDKLLTGASAFNENCYYHGHLKGFSDSLVAVDTCKGSISGLIAFSAAEKHHFHIMTHEEHADAFSEDHREAFGTVLLGTQGESILRRHPEIFNSAKDHKNWLRNLNSVRQPARRLGGEILTKNRKLYTGKHVIAKVAFMLEFALCEKVSPLTDCKGGRDHILGLINLNSAWYQKLEKMNVGNPKIELMVNYFWVVPRSKFDITTIPKTDTRRYKEPLKFARDEYKKTTPEEFKLREEAAFWHVAMGTWTYGGIAGMAYVDKVCKPVWKSGFSYTTSKLLVHRRGILMHELAHNWGCKHARDMGCTEKKVIMNGNMGDDGYWSSCCEKRIINSVEKYATKDCLKPVVVNPVTFPTPNTYPPPPPPPPPSSPCAVNQKVVSNKCVGCPAGKSNAKDDDPNGPDTYCDAILCSVNQKVVSNACVYCPSGKTNAEGDNASGPDTNCDATPSPTPNPNSNPTPAGPNPTPAEPSPTPAGPSPTPAGPNPTPPSTPIACSSGQCCDLQKGILLNRGLPCKSQSVADDCNVINYCNGTTNICPTDFYKIDGLSCKNSKCYDGKCVSAHSQCEEEFGGIGSVGKWKSCNSLGLTNTCMSLYCTTGNPTELSECIELIQGENGSDNSNNETGKDLTNVTTLLDEGSPCGKPEDNKICKTDSSGSVLTCEARSQIIFTREKDCNSRGFGVQDRLNPGQSPTCKCDYNYYGAKCESYDDSVDCNRFRRHGTVMPGICGPCLSGFSSSNPTVVNSMCDLHSVPDGREKPRVEVGVSLFMKGIHAKTFRNSLSLRNHLVKVLAEVLNIPVDHIVIKSLTDENNEITEIALTITRSLDTEDEATREGFRFTKIVEKVGIIGSDEHVSFTNSWKDTSEVPAGDKDAVDLAITGTTLTRTKSTPVVVVPGLTPIYTGDALAPSKVSHLFSSDEYDYIAAFPCSECRFTPDGNPHMGYGHSSVNKSNSSFISRAPYAGVAYQLEREDLTLLSPWNVESYSITSNSYLASRDPRSWVLQATKMQSQAVFSNQSRLLVVTDVDYQWIDIDVQENVIFESRGQTKVFEILKSKRECYTRYRFKFKSNRIPEVEPYT
eukprot:g1283.t1